MKTDHYERLAKFPNRTLFKKKKGTYAEVNGQTFYLTKVVRESYYYVFFGGQPASDPNETAF